MEHLDLETTAVLQESAASSPISDSEETKSKTELLTTTRRPIAQWLAVK